jgi:DNA polymerase III subunit gamma/tau
MQENSTINLQKGPEYLVLARRYRPQSFADVLSHDAVVKTLKSALLAQKTSHAYLFSGPRGTGKTTLARLFAKALNCTCLKADAEPCNSCASCQEITDSRSIDVQEIDGASHRGIDNIRAITEGAAYAPASSRFKIYIIDEAHMLTKEAWNALLKTLEEPPPSVKFFFATTEPHKIPQTILSRCQRFSLRRIPHSFIVAKLQKIAQDVGVTSNEACLLRLADYADGALRDAESLFDQLITFSNGSITESVLEEVLGIAPFDWLLELDRAMDTVDVSIAYKISDQVFFEGKDIGHFIEDLCDHFKTLLLLKLDIPLQRACPDEKTEQLVKITKTISQEHLIEILSLLAEAQKSMNTASQERFLLEWLLISIVRIKRKVPLPLIVKKLFELQEKLPQQEAQTEEPKLVAAPPHPVPELKKEPAPIPEVKKEPAAVPENLVCKVERKTPSAQTPHEEECRQENLLRFAAVELGATLSKKT